MPNPVTNILNSGADGFIGADYDPAIALAVNALEMLEGVNTGGGSLKNVVGQSIPEYLATSDVAATAGSEFSVLVPLAAGTVVNNISIFVGTGASTPTHSFVGLAFGTKVVAVSADALTTALPANTLATYALTAPYVVPVTGLYAVFFAVAGTTGPTVSAAVTLGTAGLGAVVFASGPGATGVTIPPVVGATFTKPTANAAIPLVYLN